MSRRTRAAMASAILALATTVLAACTPATVAGQGAVRTGGGTSSSGTPTPPQEPAANFVNCSNAFRLSALHFPPGRLAHLSIECAVISVPLNYADPSGAQIKLVLTKIHDDA